MSRLCAKPTCTEDAVTWLDVARHDRRVVERSRSELSAMGLCAAHRERFVVPTGWVLEEIDAIVPIPETTAGSHAVAPGVSTAPETSNPTTSRERPWFLSQADDVPASTNSVPTPRASYDDEMGENALSAGSLLRRAFHGPDADDDLQRRDADAADADVESTDEPEGLDRQRSMRTLDEYGTAQLPFPPSDLTSHAAVS